MAKDKSDTNAPKKGSKSSSRGKAETRAASKRGSSRSRAAESAGAAVSGNTDMGAPRGAAAGSGGGDDRSTVIAALMTLVGDRGWSAVTLRDIAKETGISLGRLRTLYDSKAAILAGFMAQIDEIVLERAENEAVAAEEEETASRDRIFDIVMMRLEALAPYKQALQAILRDAPSLLNSTPVLLQAQMASQRWMLTAADIDTRGPRGAMKVAGLGLIYGRVLSIWLREEDPALPRTLAELDRQLRRGDRTLDRLEVPVSVACSGFRLFCSFARQLGGLKDEYKRQRRDRDMRRGEASLRNGDEPEADVEGAPA